MLRRKRGALLLIRTWSWKRLFQIISPEEEKLSQDQSNRREDKPCKNPEFRALGRGNE